MTIDAAAQAAVRWPDGQLDVSDERALQRLVLTYGICSDFGLVDELVELFEPDALWDGTGFRFPRCEGREEIHRWFTEVCGKGVRQVHVMEPAVFTAGDTPDRARGFVQFNAMEAAEDGRGLFASQHAYGIYEDAYRKRDDVWRFDRRTLHLRLVRR
jgi:hypothetical protein